MINLFYDCYRVLSEVYSDGAYLKQSLKDVPIEELNRAKTVKICYGVLDNDIYLDYALSFCYDKPPKQKIKILLKIGAYTITFLKKKPFAVIDNLVELTKKLGKVANAGFVNAVLRKYAKQTLVLPTDKAKFLSVKYSFPEFAVEKILGEYGDEAEKILSFDKEYTYLRFDSGESGEKYLSKKGLAYEKTPFDGLFSVANAKMDEGFFDGEYTFQSIGSVAICSALSGGKSLLDACAAPGGKSVLLAERYENVTACELHEHRAELIKAYAERMGKKNIEVCVKDSTVFDPELKEKFDAVLCDAPCSGYGTIKQNPDIKLRKTDENLKELTAIQLKILLNVASYVKCGGELVYSTCSIFNEENDGIIEKFLAKKKNFEVEKINCPLDGLKKKYGLQFLPELSLGAGFYVCKLKRIK